MKKRYAAVASLVACLLIAGCAQDDNPSAPDANRLDENYLFSAQFLYAFFIFQDRLPENPFAFESPVELYASVNEPFTAYLPADDAQNFLNNLDTESAGFGVIVDSVEPGYVITRVFESSPADDAGLQEGDTLVQVDGVSLQAVPFARLARLLSGEIGEQKRVTIRRAGQTVTATVVIDEFLAPSVFADSLDSAIAYVRISAFFSRTAAERGTAAEFRDALEKTSWAASTVLDLRDNPGGELGQALEVADEFLPAQAPMIQVTERAFNQQTSEAFTRDTVFRATAGGRALDRQFVILMNENTASASELVIAALMANRPAIAFVGETTFGKGRGQTVTVTPDSGVARVTYALINPVGGEPYDLVGIEPDVPVAPGAEPLQAAVDAAEATLAKRYVAAIARLSRIEATRLMFPCPAGEPLAFRWSAVRTDALLLFQLPAR